MTIGGKESDICTEEDPCLLIIDSGTSIITAPTTKLMSIYDEIPDECEKGYSNMPDLTFYIQGIPYDIKPRDYMIGMKQDG